MYIVLRLKLEGNVDYVVSPNKPTSLKIPPSVSTSAHVGPLLCTRGYFSTCIVFLYILLKNK